MSGTCRFGAGQLLDFSGCVVKSLRAALSRTVVERKSYRMVFRDQMVAVRFRGRSPITLPAATDCIPGTEYAIKNEGGRAQASW